MCVLKSEQDVSALVWEGKPAAAVSAAKGSRPAEGGEAGEQERDLQCHLSASTH